MERLSYDQGSLLSKLSPRTAFVLFCCALSLAAYVSHRAIETSGVSGAVNGAEDVIVWRDRTSTLFPVAGFLQVWLLLGFAGMAPTCPTAYLRLLTMVFFYGSVVLAVVMPVLFVLGLPIGMEYFVLMPGIIGMAAGSYTFYRWKWRGWKESSDPAVVVTSTSSRAQYESHVNIKNDPDTPRNS